MLPCGRPLVGYNYPDGELFCTRPTDRHTSRPPRPRRAPQRDLRALRPPGGRLALSPLAKKVGEAWSDAAATSDECLPKYCCMEYIQGINLNSPFVRYCFGILDSNIRSADNLLVYLHDE